MEKLVVVINTSTVESSRPLSNPALNVRPKTARALSPRFSKASISASTGDCEPRPADGFVPWALANSRARPRVEPPTPGTLEEHRPGRRRTHADRAIDRSLGRECGQTLRGVEPRPPTKSAAPCQRRSK